jgi:DNA-binding NtrC family response regulator
MGARVLAATHFDLRARVQAGLFRKDLYFLLRTVELALPPLRERKGDLPLLVSHFLARLTPRGLVAPGVAPRAWEALEAYDFPGNVRELARAIEHALALAHGSEIEREHLPVEIACGVDAGAEIAPLAVARREFERDYVRRAVALYGGDAERAAKALAVTPEALARKLGGRASEPPPAREPEGRAPGPVKTGGRSERAHGRAVGSAALDDRHDSQEVPAQSQAKLRARGDR